MDTPRPQLPDTGFRLRGGGRVAVYHHRRQNQADGVSCSQHCAVVLHPPDSDILPDQGHLYHHLSFPEIGIWQVGLPTPAFPRLQSALFHIRAYALVVVSRTCFAGFDPLGYKPTYGHKRLADNGLFLCMGGLWCSVMGVQQIIVAEKGFLEE